jgi:hypothetical protein
MLRLAILQQFQLEMEHRKMERSVSRLLGQKVLNELGSVDNMDT